MNITKKEQTHRYREQRGEGQGRVGGSEEQTTGYKINTLQGCITQHKRYSQYFIVTLNAVKS